MNIEPTITLGQLVSTGIPLVVGAFGIWSAYLIFRTKTRKEVAHLDERVNTLATGALELQREVRANQAHAEATYVKHGDFQRFEAQINASMQSLSDDVRTVIGTTSDVRDTVLRLEARTSKDAPKLPPARRKTTRSTNAGAE